MAPSGALRLLVGFMVAMICVLCGSCSSIDAGRASYVVVSRGVVTTSVMSITGRTSKQLWLGMPIAATAVAATKNCADVYLADPGHSDVARVTSSTGKLKIILSSRGAPDALALDDAEGILYVSFVNSPNIEEIRLSDDRVIGSVNVGAYPIRNLAFLAVGSSAYLLATGAGSTDAFDVHIVRGSKAAIAKVPLPGPSVGISELREAEIPGTSDVAILDDADRQIDVVNAVRGTVVKTVSLNGASGSPYMSVGAGGYGQVVVNDPGPQVAELVDVSQRSGVRVSSPLSTPALSASIATNTLRHTVGIAVEATNGPRSSSGSQILVIGVGKLLTLKYAVPIKGSAYLVASC